jgi:cytochrome c-type biogenesis protein CcmH/NrfG
MKFLVLLIIVLLVAYVLWPRQPTPPIEETFIAPQLEPLNKAQQVEDQYMKALDRANAEIEKQSDGG